MLYKALLLLSICFIHRETVAAETAATIRPTITIKNTTNLTVLVLATPSPDPAAIFGGVQLRPGESARFNGLPRQRKFVVFASAKGTFAGPKAFAVNRTIYVTTNGWQLVLTARKP
jgi:hypothetical protein